MEKTVSPSEFRMRKIRKHAALFILGAFIALSVCFVYVAARTCTFFASNFSCRLEATESILKREGVSAALAYVGAQVIPATGYSEAHFILHTVGEYAYGTSGDLDAALAYLDSYQKEAGSGPETFAFDGFVHGAVSSYFLANGNKEEYPALMQRVCRSGRNIPIVTESDRNCYHTLGHALVHASANAIDPALAVCRTADTKEAREGCFYGAFMELMFLYIPEYHADAPRPDSTGVSLLAKCERVPEDARRECAHFVGQSRLYTAGNDFTSAFAECAKLAKESESCAERLGKMTVTSFVTNKEEARAFCKKHAGSLEETCYRSAKEGIEMGLAPEDSFWR